MTFSYEVKKELSKIENKDPCCDYAMLYGMMLFSKEFSSKAISFKTENAVVAHTFVDASARVFSVYSDISTKLIKKKKSDQSLMVTIPGENQCEQIISSFGHNNDEITRRINRANLTKDKCFFPFLRGVFMMCGSISDPQKEYHLEMVVPFKKLGEDLHKLLLEVDMDFKATDRNGTTILYIKESEKIEEFLTAIGATLSTLKLMDVKLIKEVRNSANRITNCETANIDKTAKAAAEQIVAIKYIYKHKGRDFLTEELAEIADLRLECPEMSLREMSEELQISRSGVSHRMRRLIEIYKNNK